ncbi:hypothetical protein D3C79_1100070 [compost metagenome]
MEELFGEPDDEVVRLVVAVVAGFEEVSGRKEQDEAEDVEDPGERVDERGAEENEAGAGDQ